MPVGSGGNSYGGVKEAGFGIVKCSTITMQASANPVCVFVCTRACVCVCVCVAAGAGG